MQVPGRGARRATHRALGLCCRRAGPEIGQSGAESRISFVRIPLNRKNFPKVTRSRAGHSFIGIWMRPLFGLDGFKKK
ncbi:hypothetical protein CN138_22825 [Sinorhizobium meliloti]|nr:hypothetical protein CN164_11030 [Sinorhizobium meliloti]RVL55826.1 hypothetical protein CN145_02680 [Sinorhizobium meliloti]RVL68689.1 hypothetical protein CN138_22825 [Sinorhizobium meliloti]RVM25094.1 hypothetical protein CN130_28805 [Sinorhizobium meliloti]RVP62751.1 hypothetical protein CN076_05825 [Sinorhizobium meliloti]